MKYTENYQLCQWEAPDPIRREDFNTVNSTIDAALNAAQATGDRGIGVLKKLAGDMCRLAYQQDGQGTYTGWREGIAFDGLGTDNLVESTSGVAILEPANGRIRLAVDGWSGGSIPWTSQSFSLPRLTTTELLTDEWSPAGNATLNAIEITGKLSSGVTSTVQLHAVLMRDETELATSGTDEIERNSGTANSATLTFPAGTLIKAEETYRLKIVVYNNIGNVDQTVTLTNTSIPVTATAVRCTQGGFTTALLPLEGKEITAWVQAGQDAVVTAELELPEGWANMTPEQARDSQTPEGDTCQELIFNLAMPQALSAARLRFSVESETECMIYGYGAIAI